MQEISREVDIHRESMERKRRACGIEPGPDGRYSTLQLVAMTTGQGADGKVSKAEADRQLTVARKQLIDLEMQAVRKERVPLDVVAAINDRAHACMVGVLKAHLDRVLTPAALNDLMAEMRAIGTQLEKWAKNG